MEERDFSQRIVVVESSGAYPLKIDRVDVYGASILIVEGDVNAYTTIELRELVTTIVETEEAKEIILDLLKMDFIDSVGLGTLVGCLKRTAERGGGISLVCNDQEIRKVFDITGLSKIFGVYEAPEQALAASLTIRSWSLMTAPSDAARMEARINRLSGLGAPGIIIDLADFIRANIIFRTSIDQVVGMALKANLRVLLAFCEAYNADKREELEQALGISGFDDHRAALDELAKMIDLSAIYPAEASTA